MTGEHNAKRCTVSNRLYYKEIYILSFKGSRLWWTVG